MKFSFGYKLEPTSVKNENPGPGAYESQTYIKAVPKRIIASVQPRQIRPIVNNNHCSQQKVLNKTPSRQTIPKAPRNDTLSLPQLSGIYYNISQKFGDLKGPSLERSAKRTFNYHTDVPGVGSYSVLEQSRTSPRIRKVFHNSFRDMSYLQRSNAKIGPGSYRIASQTSKQNQFSFSHGPRSIESVSDIPSVGQYSPRELEKPQQVTFTKEKLRELSSYAIRKKYTDQTPSPMKYETIKSFNRAITNQRYIALPNSQRKFHEIQYTPGPGQYDPYGLHKQLKKLRKKNKPTQNESTKLQRMISYEQSMISSRRKI